MSTTDMPEETGAVETTTSSPDGVEQFDASAEVGGDREAVKYRRRLRETEAQRDQLQARVVALQTAEARRLAGEALADPDDLFAVGGVALESLLDQAGDVSAEAVAQAVAGMLATRPRLAKDRPDPRDPGQGANRGYTAPPRSGFADGFKAARRRG